MRIAWFLLFTRGAYYTDEHKDHNPHEDGAVGEVEGWPVVYTHMKIQKIRDRAQTYAICDIACCATDDGAQRSRRDGVMRAREPDKEQKRNNGRGNRQ